MNENLIPLTDKIAGAIVKIDNSEFPVELERILKEAKLQMSVLVHIASRQEIFQFVVETVAPLEYYVNGNNQFDYLVDRPLALSQREIPTQQPKLYGRQEHHIPRKSAPKHKTTDNKDEF